MTDRPRSLLLTILALLALDISVTFANLWPTPAITWHGQLSLELAVLVCGLALTRSSGIVPSARLLRCLTIVWLLLVVGRYTFVTSPALWGRELNFYWDLRFLPDVLSMLAQAAPVWMVILASVGAAAGVMLAYVLVRWALRTVDASLALPGRRRFMTVAAACAIVAFIGVRTLAPPDTPPIFAAPVSEGYAHQVRFVFQATLGDKKVPASPSFESDLARLNGADVLLFFIESYGAVVFERPEFAAQTSTRRAMFEAAIYESGNDVASAFVTSPTFGGSSWFAHISLLSGIPVRDPDTNARLMREKRDTLPAAMARRGYRSVALMPGLWTPWPEGAFYGFQEIYNGPSLNYPGPPFGWWDMPDQFTLAKLDQLERDTPMRRPLFVFFPTVSTHAPFSPVAPYQADWPRLFTDRPFDESDLERVYDEAVDWSNLGPNYAKSIGYAYESLAGYLAKHRGEPFVMIVLGDHQPPALVSGEGAPWDVPVHIITSNADILARVKDSGFTAGVTPSRPPFGTMDALLPMLLRAFGEPEQRHAD